MDSLLSNAQRCARKADQLVNYGLFDEALAQLDNSIAFLSELKSFNTKHETLQMLDVQIEAIDRKQRSVAIKRDESIKKKKQMELMILNQQKKLAAMNAVNKFILDNGNNSYQNGNTQQIPSGATNVTHNGHKLTKDDKSIIEELATTNHEYKKFNKYLISEIEALKKENDYLKEELLKVHGDGDGDSRSSKAKDANMYSNLSIVNSLDMIETESHADDHAANKGQHSTQANTLPFSVSASSSSLFSMHDSGGKPLKASNSVDITSQAHANQPRAAANLNDLRSNCIDLSKYIDNEDDDDDEYDNEDEDDSDGNSNGGSLTHVGGYSHNMNLKPPNEFIID